MKTKQTQTKRIALSGAIAATYATVTFLAMMLLQNLAWGPVQFRISEALTVLPVLTSAAVPGLAIGCILANLAGGLVTGAGVMGLLDVVFGSVATLLGALWTRKFRSRPLLALAGPVISNALIVPLYLPIILKGLGFYTIPFTSINLDGAYLGMYLFGVIAVGLGQAVVVYGLGFPLLAALRRLHIFDE